MPEQFCPSCNKATLVIKKPLYDGFTRISEQLKCAVCGYVFEPPPESPPEAPATKKKLPSIFSEDDRPQEIHLFGEGENRILCRYCTHYTVNPFRQWCGLHSKEVEATDTCPRFEARPETKPPAL